MIKGVGVARLNSSCEWGLGINVKQLSFDDDVDRNLNSFNFIIFYPELHLQMCLLLLYHERICLKGFVYLFEIFDYIKDMIR